MSRSTTRSTLRRLLAGGLTAALATTGALTVATGASAQVSTGQYYQLIAVHSGKAIQIDGPGAGAMAVQWTPGSGANQQFRFEPSGSGYYRLVARHSGMVLDVFNWNPNNGAEIRQWTDLNGTNQQWSIVDRGNNQISLINRFSGKALDVWEWSTANGARISQYDSTGGANQRFQLVPVDGGGSGPGNPVWQSCDQWGNWQTGGWTLYNNIWGSGAGSQCIWANSPTNWGVHADHPNTGGVKSYPNLTRWYGRQISQIGTATSSFNVTVPTSGVAFTSTYDIWSSDNAHEVMIWVNRYGPVGAIGSYQTTVTVGGHTWDFYLGGHSGITVYSFLRQGNVHSGTVDLGAVLRWLHNSGRISNVTIGDVQFGFEITSSAGGRDFTVNSYSLNLS
ncbi:MAG TPA: RICIN domain-containing protein [Natronosporangium sp.]|nr:RICIN domain-containing protein [Natronosporangium sp.]